MEPSSSSSSSSTTAAAAATTSHREKRKSTAPTGHEEAKRLKTERGDERVEEERVHPPRTPRISVPLDRLQQPITVNELTELLHYAALGKAGGIKQPSWCRLHHQRKVQGVNVVMVDGVTQSHFYKHYLTLRHLRTSYSSRVTFTPSSSNVASEIFSNEVVSSSPPQTHKENNELHKALRNHPVITKFGTQRRGLTAYVLPEEEMIRRHFPVKGMPGFEEFVCTDSVDCVTDSSPLYGLDCEMCFTEKGNELARVSLVDSHGKCVFSGITAAMLRPVRTTLRDVRAKLKALLPRDAILVGHSLNNDLIALKLIHPHVIDTSLLYRREFGQRFKLKVLAEAVLKFADILQTLGRSVAFFGRRSDVALDLSLQQWHNSDKEMLSSFRRQTKHPFLSVLHFSSLNGCTSHQEQQSQRVCANLRDMCVVFAGPLPAGFSERKVKQLFSCCGPVRKVKMLNTAIRVHAEIEFKLLEGAALAVKTLNGLNLQGQSIKVQRPVNETMLDLNLTLDALMGDVLNSNQLYAVKLKPSVAERINLSPKVNGHTLDGVKTVNGSWPGKVNGKQLQLKTTKCELSEETVRDTFGHFGTVKRIMQSAKPGKHTRHAHIQFESSEGKQAALSSSDDLWKEDYVICPSLTPPHLKSWAAMATVLIPVDAEGEDEDKTCIHTSPQDGRKLEPANNETIGQRKLDKLLHNVEKLKKKKKKAWHPTQKPYSQPLYTHPTGTSGRMKCLTRMKSRAGVNLSCGDEEEEEEKEDEEEEEEVSLSTVSHRRHTEMAKRRCPSTLASGA
ncbi:hypothetical protein INR49_016159, partial [Caranx melampygus]